MKFLVDNIFLEVILEVKHSVQKNQEIMGVIFTVLGDC